MEKFYNTNWNIKMDIIEYLRYISQNKSFGDVDFEIRDRYVFVDFIQENISDPEIATIKLSTFRRLFVGLEFKKAIIMDFLNNINAQIDFEDLDQDDSYLVLKYGKILLREVSY